jgi:prevent-host-death family protein
MARSVSVRDLRNNTPEVVAAVQAGETLTLTVNREPVADIVPHTQQRSPWVPAAALRRILAEAPADPDLMRDIAEVRAALVEDLR